MDLRPSREVRKRTSYFGKTGFPWWAQVDSNHRPYAYQAYALTTWAMSPYWLDRQLFVSYPHPLVEMRRIELLTPCVQGRCSPSWANTPYLQQMVGLNGLEPTTSPLSGVRSNHLSYRPICWMLIKYTMWFYIMQVFFWFFLNIIINLVLDMNTVNLMIIIL